MSEQQQQQQQQAAASRKQQQQQQQQAAASRRLTLKAVHLNLLNIGYDLIFRGLNIILRVLGRW
jgi:hypothetical protein